MTTNPSNEPNYLTFASNRPRAPLLKPAAVSNDTADSLKGMDYSVERLQFELNPCLDVV